MTLKQDYFDGLTGLQNRLSVAFTTGVNFVGSGPLEISTINLGDQDATAVTIGTAPGYYFEISSSTITYRIWYKPTTETPPTSAGKTLIQVTLVPGDTSTDVATKTAAALLAIVNEPFDVEQIGTLLKITNLVSGAAGDISLGTLAGSAAVSTIQNGVAATGNYLALQTALKTAAAGGTTSFTTTITTSFNTVSLRANNGNNLLLKAYMAGIQSGLADTGIYNYECSLGLNIATADVTAIDFKFNFQTT